MKAPSAAATAVTLTALVCGAAVGSLGCDSSSGAPANLDAAADTARRMEGPLLPWAAGNSWTYRVTAAGGAVTEKVNAVGAAELVGGAGPHKDEMAFKVTTTKGVGGTDETISWQAVIDQGTGQVVVRYREQSFGASSGVLELEEHWSPHKLHVDSTPANSSTGATWLEEYQETKMVPGGQPVSSTERDRWTVLSERESVTVPAGTFDAVVVQKAGGSTTKRYWYVPHVGKVKETGGQTEELVTFNVAAP